MLCPMLNPARVFFNSLQTVKKGASCNPSIKRNTILKNKNK